MPMSEFSFLKGPIANFLPPFVAKIYPAKFMDYKGKFFRHISSFPRGSRRSGTHKNTMYAFHFFTWKYIALPEKALSTCHELRRNMKSFVGIPKDFLRRRNLDMGIIANVERRKFAEYRPGRNSQSIFLWGRAPAVYNPFVAGITAPLAAWVKSDNRETHEYFQELIARDNARDERGPVDRGTRPLWIRTRGHVRCHRTMFSGLRNLALGLKKVFLRFGRWVVELDGSGERSGDVCVFCATARWNSSRNNCNRMENSSLWRRIDAKFVASENQLNKLEKCIPCFYFFCIFRKYVQEKFEIGIITETRKVSLGRKLFSYLNDWLLEKFVVNLF